MAARCRVVFIVCPFFCLIVVLKGSCLASILITFLGKSGLFTFLQLVACVMFVMVYLLFLLMSLVGYAL